VSNINPRLKNYKKMTAFPKEYKTQIEEVFAENFKKQIGDGKLIVEGRIYPSEVLLRVGILEKGRLSQANFEVSIEYSKKDAVQRIHDCIDAAASMMADYFETDGETEFPRTWQEFEFNKLAVYLQFTTENSDLESQADALLGASFEDMVQEDKDKEDALAAAEARVEANLADDESNEPAAPTIIIGKKKKKDPLH
jgi:hypothetical protein